MWITRLFKAQSFQSVIQFWNILKFCLQSKASETVRILVSLEAIFSRSAVWSGSLGRFNVYSIAEVAVAFKPRIYFLSEPKTPTPSKVINNSIHYDKKSLKLVVIRENQSIFQDHSVCITMIANHWFVSKYGLKTISEKILSNMIIRAVWLIDRFRDFGFLRNIWTGWGIQLKITKEVLRSFLWNWDHVSEEFEVKAGISQKPDSPKLTTLVNIPQWIERV